MLKRTRLTALVCIGIGALLGYAAATGAFDPVGRAVASPSGQAASALPEASPSPAGCCEGLDKGELLALATFNQNAAAKSQASGKKPNIVIIWGDDIGQSNVSAYTMGLMGYRTPEYRQHCQARA